MSEVILNRLVNLKEAEDMIVGMGEGATFHLMGEPGVGKTSMFGFPGCRWADKIPGQRL